MIDQNHPRAKRSCIRHPVDLALEGSHTKAQVQFVLPCTKSRNGWLLMFNWPHKHCVASWTWAIRGHNRHHLQPQLVLHTSILHCQIAALLLASQALLHYTACSSTSTLANILPWTAPLSTSIEQVFSYSSHECTQRYAHTRVVINFLGWKISWLLS